MRAGSNRYLRGISRPGLGLALLCVFGGLLGLAFVQFSARQLLEAEARLDAEQWSRDLARDIPGLKSLAAGGTPSAATISYLQQTQGFSPVLSFRVYDAGGLLKLWPEGASQAQSQGQAIEKIDPEFASALRERVPKTIIKRAGAQGEAGIYASTILPITDNFRTVGWLVADIDQRGRNALFRSLTTRISLAAGLLLIAVSALVLWRRAYRYAQVEHTIETLARHDQLTGLFNKSAFLEEVETRMTISQRPGEQSALVLIEVSGSTAASQTHGQDAEDHIIRTVAQRLAESVAEPLEVAAMGRNVFARFISGVTDPMLVLSLVKDLTGKLGEPVQWHDQTLAAQVHAGIALSSTDGENVTALMRSAELALHSAQEQGTPGYGFFNPDIAKDTRRKIAVQRAVATAAANQSFHLDFQPVYDIRTGAVNGFEALIRLHDPSIGAISPAEFIPIAEQMGVISSIGAWCLEEACRVAVQWPAHLVVAVNLSPFQFFTGTLINDVRNALTQNQFPSYRLEVEITEGTLLNDSELVLSQLRVLRDMGVAVALDDFGTGYSSLSYLWKFPFSKLKIDRSFVQGLDESQSAKGILRSIIKLGHGLGLTVTAEGIETAKQFTILRDLGCDLAQGYLLDRPARIADLAAIILRNFANGLNRRVRVASIVPEASKQTAA